MTEDGSRPLSWAALPGPITAAALGPASVGMGRAKTELRCLRSARPLPARPALHVHQCRALPIYVRSSHGCYGRTPRLPLAGHVAW